MSVKKRLITFLIVLTAAGVSCGPQVDRATLDLFKNRSSAPQHRYRVGLLLGPAGLGDQSFMDMHYNGLIKAYAALDIHAAFRVPKNYQPQELRRNFKSLIEEERCGLIIVAESDRMKKVTLQMAKSHPEVKFVMSNAGVRNVKNIISTRFAQNEGSFVVGVLAGGMSSSGRVAFIGGVDIPIVRDFAAGFRQGLRYSGKRIKPVFRYLSRKPDYSGFNNPGKGYQLAKKLYSDGVDVIYAVAGGSGSGVIQAASDLKKFVIGVDINQDYLAPGRVLTSMMIRVDRAVTNLIGRYTRDNLPGGRIYRFDYRSGGVGLTEMEFTKDKIPQKLLAAVHRVEKMISNRKIKVNSVF